MVVYITKPCTGSIVSRGMGQTLWWFGEKNIPYNSADSRCIFTGERIMRHWDSSYGSCGYGKCYRDTRLYDVVWDRVLESEGVSSDTVGVLDVLCNISIYGYARPIPEWYVHDRIWILKVEFDSFDGEFEVSELCNRYMSLGLKRDEDDLGFPWNSWYNDYKKDLL